MNRRSFMKFLGVGVVAAAAMPVLTGFEAKPEESDIDYYRRMKAEAGPSDPNDPIKGWVSYRWHYTVTLPPNNVSRIRLIDAASAIS